MRLNLFIRTITFLPIVLVFYGCPSEELTSARLYVQQEDWAKAEDMIKAAIEVTPDDPEPYYLMGKEIYGRNSQWKEMNEMFNKALDLNASYKLPDGQTIQSSVETWRTVHWSREFNIGADAFNLALRAEDKDEKKSHLIEAIEIGRADALDIASMLHYSTLKTKMLSEKEFKEEGNIDFLKENTNFNVFGSHKLIDIKKILSMNDIPLRTDN